MNKTETLTTKRYPWLAVFLSLLMPGLGQLYCGATIKSFWIAGGMSGISMIGLITLVLLPSIHRIPIPGWQILGFAILNFIFYVFNLFDAMLTARKTRADYKLKDYNRWYAYLLFWVAVSGGYLFSTLFIRDNLIQPFQVPTSGLYPTVYPGDKILVQKNIYLKKNPAPGDIVVFPYPKDRRQFSIKRVIALEGDSIEIRDGEIFINDVPLKREEASKPRTQPREIKSDGKYFHEWNQGNKYPIFLRDNAGDTLRNFPRTIIPSHDCFVLGDDRDNSLDSRDFGVVPIASIIGKAIFIFEPADDWSRFGSIRQQGTETGTTK